jgi:hypothetical protein
MSTNGWRNDSRSTGPVFERWPIGCSVADLDAQCEVVDAFLAAARDGEFEALLEVLDPDVVRAFSTRDGEPFSVGGFTVRGGRIVEIDILADPGRLRRLELTILDSSEGGIDER